MVQDDGTAPIPASAIEVGDDGDRKGEAASTSTTTATTAALKESGNGFNTRTYEHYVTHSYKLLCDRQNVPLRLLPQLHPLVATIV